FFFQAEDGIRDFHVTGVQTCALPIFPFTAVVFEEVDTVYNAYEQGRCDAVTSDTSQLASRRAVMANPDDHVILDVTISKEPLGPATRHGDNQWHDIVT